MNAYPTRQSLRREASRRSQRGFSLLEIMLVALLPSFGGFKDAFAFLILIGILLFRPIGIMGEKLPD